MWSSSSKAPIFATFIINFWTLFHNHLRTKKNNGAIQGSITIFESDWWCWSGEEGQWTCMLCLSHGLLAFWWCLVACIRLSCERLFDNVQQRKCQSNDSATLSSHLSPSLHRRLPWYINGISGCCAIMCCFCVLGFFVLCHCALPSRVPY